MASAKPPFIMTGDPGSYAMRTITERKPRIIADVIESNSLDDTARRRLESLRDQIRDGAIDDPLSAAPPGALAPAERAAWQEEIRRHAGRGWLEIPWYFAEAFFYLKLLLAFGYYENGVDPFQSLKDRELFAPDGGLARARRTAAAVRALEEPSEALRLLLHAALWGNRVDLSNFDVTPEARHGMLSSDAENLLIDHTAKLVDVLRRARRVDVILDNCGPELACDLLLAEFLLRSRSEVSVVLHVKQSPFFVSDAMEKDVLSTTAAFAADSEQSLGNAGHDLERALASGRLQVAPHFFWNGPLHFTRLPPEIATALSESDIVVVKGDANYRRLLEDRKWPFDASLCKITSYFPATFAVLRTLKAELVVDVPLRTARDLSRADPDWLINGKRGIVQVCGYRSGSLRRSAG